MVGSKAESVATWYSYAACCLFAWSGCAHTSVQGRAKEPVTTTSQSPELNERPSTSAEPWALASAEPLDPSLTDHFQIALWARDAMIEGNLSAVREPLQALADYRYTTSELGTWAPAIAELQRTAGEIARSSSLGVAAEGVATMAKICGSCHAANAAREVPQTLAHPPAWFAASDLRLRMDSHQWAADRLWHGLVDPSDSAWDAGAAVLTGLALAPHDGPSGDFYAALTRVRELGAAARTATMPEGRSQVYARLLATCATCHASSHVINARAWSSTRAP